MSDIILLKETIEKETGLNLQSVPSVDDLRICLTTYINELIANDFEKLLFILYRIDINENAIKLLLQQTEKVSAGETIADAILTRQLEKIALRKQFTPTSDDASEEEKW